MVSILPALKKRYEWRYGKRSVPRITFISQFFPPDFASTGQLLSDLTGRLSSTFQIQVLTGMPSYAFKTCEAPRVEFSFNRIIRRSTSSRFFPARIRGRAINSALFTLRNIYRLFRSSRRGDLLVLTTEPAYLPLIGTLIHYIFRARYVLLLFDMYPDVLYEVGFLRKDSVVVRLWAHLLSLSIVKAARVVVLSEKMLERTLEYSPSSKYKIDIIEPWADPDFIKPINRATNDFCIQHGIVDKFVVMYSGNQGRCHDLYTLLCSAVSLRSQPNIRFLIIGDGAQHQKICDFAYQMSLSNVSFLNYQEYEDIPFSLAAASLAVVSVGLGSDGVVAPSKLFGHLAAGSPIAAIGSQSSSLHSFVNQYKCGRCFENGDSVSLSRWIVELSQNEESVKYYSSNARLVLDSIGSSTIALDKYTKTLSKALAI